MATIKMLEDLTAWNKARILNQELKSEVKLLEDLRHYSLKEQLMSAAGSVADNIAEGFGRMSKNEFKNFLTIAHGSLIEVLSQVYRLYDFEIIVEERLAFLKTGIDEISRLIRSFIEYLLRTDIKGKKFQGVKPSNS
jgi:four helix bundle protein